MNSGSNMGTQGLQLPNKTLLLEGFLDGQTEAIRRSGPAIACVFPAKFLIRLMQANARMFDKFGA